MKKIIAAVLACLMIGAVFAGCSDPLQQKADVPTTEPQATEAATEKETEPETEEAKTYKNDLDGLRDYLIDKGYISEKAKADNTEIYKDASVIGAKSSHFYAGDGCTVELYLYTDAVPEKYKKTISEDNTITLYGKTIRNVYLTQSGKYLMIYNDSLAADENSDNYKKLKKCVKDFNSFESVATEAAGKSDKKDSTEKTTEKTTEKETESETESETDK